VSLHFGLFTDTSFMKAVGYLSSIDIFFGNRDRFYMFNAENFKLDLERTSLWRTSSTRERVSSSFHYSAAIKIAAKKSANASCPSSGSTCETY